VASDRAVVVEAEKGDDILDIILTRDVACGRTLPIGEHGMRDDPAGVPQLGPDVFGEAEVSGMVAVQMTDLPGSEGEGELAAATGAGVYARPGGDLPCDPLARCGGARHVVLLGWRMDERQRYKFK